MTDTSGLPGDSFVHRETNTIWVHDGESFKDTKLTYPQAYGHYERATEPEEPDTDETIADLRAQLNAQADQIERLSEAVKVLGSLYIYGNIVHPPHYIHGSQGDGSNYTMKQLRALFGIEPTKPEHDWTAHNVTAKEYPTR